MQAETQQPRYSTAGFYTTTNSPRQVSSLNPDWKLKLGTIPAEQKPYASDYDDSSWSSVNLPNGLEVLPLDASGGVNYQGEAWYRKWMTLPKEEAGKRHILYFEGIMGKSKLYVNGELIKEHAGGYLPLAADVTGKLKTGEKNLIAVWADNADDTDCPPGKPQHALDFCYFGGIYRDVWMISTSPKLYVTDENMAGKVAGGGMFIATLSANARQAEMEVKLDVAGSSPTGHARLEWINPDGLAVLTQTIKVKHGENKVNATLGTPALWSPQHPRLYTLRVSLFDEQEQLCDDFTRRVGIRFIEFSHDKGLILNGTPYPRKLIGANRHQDFAHIGNALSNSLHWRDAAKLKSLGMEVIRNGHYPQDPAFMDACDELGLFVIINTPGWQHWSNAPIFAERVFNDIAQMARRDRSRPSAFIWEPMLNEVAAGGHVVGGDFSQLVHNIVKEEIPYTGSNYTACDENVTSSKDYDIIFTHPNLKRDAAGKLSREGRDKKKVYFTREWGDNVDNWSSHNSPSRVARNWGEIPQLIQAQHYASPTYDYTCYETLQEAPAFHFGGTLWHSFDHQRGYHPDPFYGGVMDAFRREKYSAAMFRAQTDLLAPNVFIANELTPFSPHDVTVFSNCPRVRLTSTITATGEKKVLEMTRKPKQRWVTFPDIWDHQADKAVVRSKEYRQRIQDVKLLVEGLDKDGKVIASQTKRPARRASLLQLTADTMGITPVANGGDLVVVTASITDSHGNVKRLNNGTVRFSIEGAGELVSDNANNEAPLLWGEASILVRTTTQAGEIKVSVAPILHGTHTPQGTSISFPSIPSPHPLIGNATPTEKTSPEKATAPDTAQSRGQELSPEQRAAIEKSLREVEAQQDQFGEQR